MPLLQSPTINNLTAINVSFINNTLNINESYQDYNDMEIMELDLKSLRILQSMNSSIYNEQIIRDIVIDERHKLLYCDIPKCASTMFKKLFLSIGNEDHHFKFYRGQHWRIKDWQKDHGNLVYKTYDKFNDSEWIKFVIIRDPLERLLSGYLNRCFDVNDRDCNKYKPKDGNLTFESFVNGVTLKLKSGNIETISRLNIHWKPQFLSCKLFKFLTEYTDIIQYKYTTIGIDTLGFLRKYSLENYFYYDKVKTKDMFAQVTWHKHTNVSKEGGLDAEIAFYGKYYKTKEMAMNVGKAYQIDYNLFKMSIPEWVDYLPS